METCRCPRSSKFRSAAIIAIPFVSLSLALIAGPAQAQNSGPDPGAVCVGGQLTMHLRPDTGGSCASQMADDTEDRLTDIVAVPDIKPWNVVVYTPAGDSPAIYVLGRRFVTLNPATVKASGGGSAKAMAIRWAKSLQQILPRIDIRLPNEAEPKVPAHPPLIVTASLSKVGGDVGPVDFRGKTVMELHGVQPGGETAAERADLLSTRLNLLAFKMARSPRCGVSVTADPDRSAQIEMGGKPVYRVTETDARESGAPSPAALARSWARKIQGAMEE